MQHSHRILIGINTQFGKTMLIFQPALKNECRSEENYNWSAKPAITSNGEHCGGAIVLGGQLSGGLLSGGYCPGGYCPRPVSAICL